MVDKTIKVAVIGTGMGRFHMEGFAEQENVELTAVCDLNETEARFYAEKYGAKTVTTDYHNLLSDPDVDIISIATPNNLHAPMAIDALNAGKHVLCEKPMAINFSDARQMAAAAEKNKCRLMINQSQRFSPDTHMLRQYLDQGQFGDIFFSRVSWVRRKGTPVVNFAPGGTMARGTWFISKEEAGAGCLMDIGVHLIDLGWYLMGSPKPVAVTGNTFLKTALPHMLKKGYPAEVDDLSAFHIKFENGAALQGAVCWDSHMSPDHWAQIYGTEGGASLFPAKFYRGGDILETVDLSNPVNGLPTPTAYAHMIDCVRNPEKTLIASGAEMVTIIQILNAILESAETGHEVRLD